MQGILLFKEYTLFVDNPGFHVTKFLLPLQTSLGGNHMGRLHCCPMTLNIVPLLHCSLGPIPSILTFILVILIRYVLYVLH